MNLLYNKIYCLYAIMLGEGRLFMNQRIFYYDKTLDIEVYSFQGISQSFPNHFHEHYVIGLLEQGKRTLYCKNNIYNMEKGAFFLLNPNENHSCVSDDNSPFYYIGLNIKKESMKKHIKEITKKQQLFYFQTTICYDKQLQICFQKLHKQLLEKQTAFQKEELFYIFFTMLLECYSNTNLKNISEYNKEVEKVCQFIHNNYNQAITLKKLCDIAHLSKSTLLRAFTKTKGITPYRYLETVRINKAKEMLEKGISPLQTAMETGFSDQSHLNHFFMKLIGIPPATYKAIWQTNQYQ